MKLIIPVMRVAEEEHEIRLLVSTDELVNITRAARDLVPEAELEKMKKK